MAEPLIPARLTRAGDGTPFSDTYGDVYHSADGGPGQARHVFLAGNGLPERWRGRDRFVILETGFGTGLNFLRTWAAWRADPAASGHLHYLAVEKHPFPAADLAQIQAAWPELSDLSKALRAAWPVLVPGFHRLEFDAGRVSLTLMFGDGERCLKQLAVRVDAFYLDGFAPARNPDLWSPSLMRRLARLAAPQASLATWCVAGPVREALAAAGFRLEKRPGYASKREMLTGCMEASTGAVTPNPAPAERHALIIGAGLAGCASAYSLARRGWQITLLDRHPEPAREASGNLAGLVRPLVSLDDNIASRFTRAAFLHAARTWRGFQAAGLNPGWRPGGVLHIAKDAPHEAHQRELVAAHDYPREFLEFVDQAQASELASWSVAHGGWWFPQAGWAHPPGVCAANLAASGQALTRLFGREVAELEHRDQAWHALDRDGQVLASAPVVILAAGAQAGQLRQASGLPIKRVRGQVTHLPAAALPPLRHALCRDGYVVPGPNGLVCAGATYDFETETEPSREADLGNLARLELILPGATPVLEGQIMGGRVGFRGVPPDRLPLIGAVSDLASPSPAGELALADLPRQPGLYALLGLASRGLVWSQLAAELLAAQLDGEPLPLEADLVAALDPGRFLLRRLRKANRR